MTREVPKVSKVLSKREFIASFIDISILNTHYLTMNKMDVGTQNTLLYGCFAYVQAIIHQLKLVCHFPVQMHKLYSKITFAYYNFISKLW